MEQRKSIEIFDVAKFIMSIMVVGIHTLGKYGIYPLFRIAVPLFFMISSYLFFKNSSKRGNAKYLKKFCVRNIKLYSFWFIILMPVFLWFGGYLKGNLPLNAVKLIAKIFFGSTFSASWYISALVIGMCFVFFWDNLKINYRILLIITFVIYAICCFNSNYRNLMEDSSFVVMLNKVYPGTIYNSFLVGLFWITLGYVFVHKKSIYNKKRSLICLFFSCIFLLAEYFIVEKYHCTVDNDCYFMLVPVCYFIFENLANSNLQFKKINVRLLRKYSTIIYCVHGSLAIIIEHCWLPKSNVTDCFLKFAIVLAISLIVAYLIFVFEKKKMFKWLHYAY